jgi:sugar lactone lactonase YvrE
MPRSPALPLALAVALLLVGRTPAQTPIQPTPAPELDGGTHWINTGKPLTLKKDLKGKIVILDFWTLCCINCMHIMKELTELEEKYKNEVVVIGVHSPKFETEKDNETLRKAVLRYELKHPVVNDADKKIWTAYNANWWPTIAIIDPDGNVVAGAAGEPQVDFKGIEKVVDALVLKHRRNKTLDETPLRFDTAKFRDGPDTPLYFPGKVVADGKGKRLFIADSTHHRIVVTDLDGKKIAVAGNGQPGKVDGAFDRAEFDDPQGMAIDGDTVYVADRKNNCIRVLDMKAQKVSTLPGTTKTFQIPRTARAMQCTPWDVLLDGKKLYVAMSGSHQIWVYDLKTSKFAAFAGDADENIQDGPAAKAKFAQPSGLASDGKTLYVADAEVSAVRTVSLSSGEVGTLVGRGLFVFGDRDGPGRLADETQRKASEALLQHCLGVAVYQDKALFVADTYNSKLKVIDLAGGGVLTFLGGPAKKGEEAVFNEPAGISVLGDTLYVADTNAHRIRTVDLKTKAVKTLELKGVEPVQKEEKEKK